jgi:hypothetical protein
MHLSAMGWSGITSSSTLAARVIGGELTMNRHWLVWLVAAALLELACASSVNKNLSAFTKNTLADYTGDGDKLKNLQFFLEGKLELEGNLESVNVEIGRYHELIVRKSALIDRVRLSDRLPGRIMKIEPSWPSKFPLLKKITNRVGIEIKYTLWISFEEDDSKVLPFRPDPAGYYALSETKPGSAKVQYGTKEYKIVSQRPMNALWYNLDYKESNGNQRRNLPGRKFID